MEPTLKALLNGTLLLLLAFAFAGIAGAIWRSMYVFAVLMSISTIYAFILVSSKSAKAQLSAKLLLSNKKIGLVITLLILIASTCIWHVWLHSVGHTGYTYKHTPEDTKQLLEVAFLATTAVVILEEIYFRGLLFTSLKQHFSIVSALFLQSMAYVLLHGLASQGLADFKWLQLALMGLTFGILTHCTGSLLLPILLHGFWNFYAVFQAVLYGPNSDSQFTEEQYMHALRLISITVWCVVFLFVIGIYRKNFFTMTRK